MHLIGNMMYLIIFADNVEDVFGTKKFIIFYMTAGIFASISQALLDLSSEIPMIGASGAITGVLVPIYIIFPRANTRSCTFFYFYY